MKSAVYYAPGDIRVEERPEPKRERDNLVAKVQCCAICGTDLKLATVGNPRCHPPRIIGHEMVGEVVHAGEDVDGFAVGDRITLATTVACGDCPHCALGLGNMCSNAKPISYDYDGAFAEFLAVPPAAISGGNAVKVPDCVDEESAALAEPLSCAINAHQLAGVKAGDRVLILGGGPLGALHAALAKATGVADVMLVELSEPRLSMLRKIDGVTVIDGEHENVSQVVIERTSGLGADVVIVCAPSKEAQEGSLQFARKGGSISFFASLPKGGSDITIDSRTIHYNELRIVGASDSRPEHVKRAIELMAEGKIDLRGIVTHRVSLDNIHEGLELMKSRQSLKVMVYPQGVAS
ncbi:MAG: alcohol dehydrogenase catalytic domain-containing protein [Armatimonadetes bacterium]|nr:alcohol dehydrogenase catalytic domain-containing protein [Armatimonadota bacterium]